VSLREAGAKGIKCFAIELFVALFSRRTARSWWVFGALCSYLDPMRHGPPEARAFMRRLPDSLSFSAHFVLEDAPVLHHKAHSFQFTDILQRVTGNRDDIRVGSGRDHTQLTLHVEQFRCA